VQQVVALLEQELVLVLPVVVDILHCWSEHHEPAHLSSPDLITQ
jgi:hypothetical protein